MNSDDLEKIASTNPCVDVRAVELLQAVVVQLQKAGIATKREYSIEPPLGRRSDSAALCLHRKV